MKVRQSNSLLHRLSSSMAMLDQKCRDIFFTMNHHFVGHAQIRTRNSRCQQKNDQASQGGLPEEPPLEPHHSSCGGCGRSISLSISSASHKRPGPQCSYSGDSLHPGSLLSNNSCHSTLKIPNRHIHHDNPG